MLRMYPNGTEYKFIDAKFVLWRYIFCHVYNLQIVMFLWYLILNIVKKHAIY